MELRMQMISAVCLSFYVFATFLICIFRYTSRIFCIFYICLLYFISFESLEFSRVYKRCKKGVRIILLGIYFESQFFIRSDSDIG